MLPPDLHEPGSKSHITFEKVLAVEGWDAHRFFRYFLKHLKLEDQIEIRNFGGVSQFRTYPKTLKVIEGFWRVVSLGIIRDAEADAHKAFEDVRHALKEADLPAPATPRSLADGSPRVSVYILPDCANSGMLETLVWKSVQQDPVISCVQEYFECLESRDVEGPRNEHKARLLAVLASRPKPTPYIGRAAQFGYWDYESPAFSDLREFLQSL